MHDIVTFMYGVDGFNNLRFGMGGGKNWSDLTPKQQQNKIDNIRFRILDDYGEYNKYSLSEGNFNFDKRNETSILNNKNFNTIYNIERTEKEKNNLYESSKKHNWILTHKEINTAIRPQIENHELIKYFKGKKYAENEVNSFLSSFSTLNNFDSIKTSVI